MGSVVSVERHSERVLVLKMVLGDCLLNVFTVYAAYSGKLDEKRRHFGMKYFIWEVVYCKMKWSCLLEIRMGIKEVVMSAMIEHMVVLATALGMVADGSRILQFPDRVAGPVISTSK